MPIYSNHGCSMFNSIFQYGWSESNHQQIHPVGIHPFRCVWMAGRCKSLRGTFVANWDRRTSLDISDVFFFQPVDRSQVRLFCHGVCHGWCGCGSVELGVTALGPRKGCHMSVHIELTVSCDWTLSQMSLRLGWRSVELCDSAFNGLIYFKVFWNVGSSTKVLTWNLSRTCKPHTHTHTHTKNKTHADKRLDAYGVIKI